MNKIILATMAITTMFFSCTSEGGMVNVSDGSNTTVGEAPFTWSKTIQYAISIDGNQIVLHESICNDLGHYEANHEDTSTFVIEENQLKILVSDSDVVMNVYTGGSSLTSGIWTSIGEECVAGVDSSQCEIHVYEEDSNFTQTLQFTNSLLTMTAVNRNYCWSEMLMEYKSSAIDLDRCNAYGIPSQSGDTAIYSLKMINATTGEGEEVFTYQGKECVRHYYPDVPLTEAICQEQWSSFVESGAAEYMTFDGYYEAEDPRNKVNYEAFLTCIKESGFQSSTGQATSSLLLGNNAASKLW